MSALPADNAGHDPVALVTGAARNIGRASAIALADAGSLILATDVDAQGLAETVALIERTHGSDRVVARVVDLSDADAPTALVDGAVAQWDRLDTIVHCAVDSGRGAVGSWTVAQWDKAHAINVRSGAFLVQAALPYLQTSDRASVVLLSSVHAQVTHQHCALYAATKGGVEALTRGLAVELGPVGIRVNAIQPGWVPAAPMTPTAVQLASYPLARLGRPDEIAAAVVFLTSSASAWTTGAILTINGGSRAISAEASAYSAANAVGSESSRLRQRIKRFVGRIRP